MIYDLRLVLLILFHFIFFPNKTVLALAYNLSNLVCSEEHHAIYGAAFIEAAWQAVRGGHLGVFAHNF